jgi:hypothetical protein
MVESDVAFAPLLAFVERGVGGRRRRRRRSPSSSLPLGRRPSSRIVNDDAVMRDFGFAPMLWRWYDDMNKNAARSVDVATTRNTTIAMRCGG